VYGTPVPPGPPGATEAKGAGVLLPIGVGVLVIVAIAVGLVVFGGGSDRPERADADVEEVDRADRRGDDDRRAADDDDVFDADEDAAGEAGEATDPDATLPEGEIPEDVLPPPAEPVTPAVPGDGVDPRPAVTRDQLIASLQRVYQPAFAACFADQLIARLSTDELKDVYYGPLSGELAQDDRIEVMISVDACDCPTAPGHRSHGR